MSQRVVDPDRQTRRQFCMRTCSATALAAVGAFALLGQGCGDSPTTAEGDGSAPPLPVIDATVSGRLVSVSITGASALAAVPSSAFIRSALGDFLVARTGPQAFKALTTICTHQLYDSHNVPVGGCVINTGVSGPIFVCPCHGSRFNASGAVVVGPAPTELRSYLTTFADNVLTISA